jgi:Tol biopolymer transport system component
MLEVNGTSWRLTVKDSRGQQVGRRTGSFPAGFGVYKYIYIGNPDNEDWPEGNGYLDNFQVKRLPSRPSPPGPPSVLKGAAVPGYKVKLEWQASSPGNPAKYNIYYDNGTGEINYNQSIGNVPHPTTTWISPALSKGITYKFGIRAENESGEEEKNADAAVSVKVIPLKQLTLQSSRDVEPRWSPGGSKIFYSSNYNIWEMNGFDGSGKKQLTQKGGENPGCSPDNSKIVFMSNRNGERNVWITNIDGSTQQILTTESANYGPTWSPDGKMIAFASRRWRNGKIWRMKPDGSDQQYLTTGGSDDWAPDYSPDGSRIVFASIRTGKIHVWAMNADGSGQRQLTFDPGDKTLATHGWSGPVWSPDGRFIAFSHGIDSNHDNKIDWRDNDNIWTMNADGSKILPITFSCSYDDENPAWSPDGTKIAFASNRNGNRDIWITDYLYDSLAFPSVNIISPIMNQMVDAEVPIIGTVRHNISVDGTTPLSLLSSWKLEYGEGVKPTKLILIKTSSKQVVNNTLAIWNTAGLSGTYTIQLTATDGKDINIQKVVVNIQR